MNLFELFVKIGVDDQASDKISSLSSKLGSGLKTAAKVGAAAVGAAATGITALTTAAVNNYGEYEQLVGGVETLFKQSADVVQQYAANAFKTAGMSANEYMETVTSFSASLLQSLDGDTAAAAEKANLAITDMSDNANKMGTNMEMIQNAYQGFAKQNFTMLDNLKLGYGGTKEEMGRLMEDAEKLAGLDPFSLNINSFDDIVTAIHIVQTEIGITGTTQKEASTTIQGSIASMKSAYENFVTGLGDQNADIAELSIKLLESAEVVAGNLLPVIENILSSIGTMMQEEGPAMIEKFVSYAIEKLPQIIELGLKMVISLVTGIANNFPQIVRAVFDIVSTIVETFVSSIPNIVDVGKQIVIGLWEGIKAMGSWIKDKVTGFFSGIVSDVKGLLGIHSPSKLFRDQIGRNIGLGVAEGLEDSKDEAVKAANKLAESVYRKSVEWLDRQTKYQKFTLSEQLQVWETIQSQFVVGSKQYLDAEEEIYDLRTKIREDFMTKASDIEKSIQSLEDEYQDALTKRAGEIFKSYGLFDAVKKQTMASGNALANNLRDQISNMEKFYDGLEELTERGVGTELVDEIRAMGPDALGELAALLSMSDEKLSEYAALYKEKQDLANKFAIEELEQLRKDTDEKIAANLADIDRLYEESAPVVGLAFSDGLASGIMEGMSSVINSAVNVAQSAVEAVKDTLGIHSPSRVFAKIGKNMALGLGDGWDDEYGRISKNIKSGLDFGTASVDFSSSGISHSKREIYAGGVSGSAANGGDIVINITETIDGATLARNQYKYNMREGTLRGGCLVEVGGI